MTLDREIVDTPISDAPAAAGDLTRRKWLRGLGVGAATVLVAGIGALLR